MAGNDSLPNLTQLLREKPRTKAGQVKAAWPYIRQAMLAGHKLTAICERLRADGLDIPYKRLWECVDRLERRRFESRGTSTAPRPQPMAGENERAAVHDPAANLRQRLGRQGGFEYQGTGKKEDLI